MTPHTSKFSDATSGFLLIVLLVAFGAVPGDALSRVFEPLFANPDAVVHRLRDSLRRDGRAREDVVTRRGHVRVSAGAIPSGELWRLEECMVPALFLQVCIYF